jgi:hypothetical protein
MKNKCDKARMQVVFHLTPIKSSDEGDVLCKLSCYIRRSSSRSEKKTIDFGSQVLPVLSGLLPGRGPESTFDLFLSMGRSTSMPTGTTDIPL